MSLNLVHNGHIKRLTDQDIQSSVLEIMGTNVTTAYITSPQNPNETLGIKLPFLVMIIKNVRSSLRSSKNISLSKYRYLMTKMYAEDLELPTISRRLEWSPSSVLCPWGSTKAGIRFSLTCQISPEEPTVATTFRRWEWQFTLTVVSEEYTFLIDFIVSKSCHQNSNCFCQSKSSNEVIRLYIIYGIASSDLQSLTFKK